MLSDWHVGQHYSYEFNEVACTTETTITTTKSTSKAFAAGADDDGSDCIVVLESRTRQTRKEKEIGKCREEIGRPRAKVHGRRPSLPSKTARPQHLKVAGFTPSIL